MGPADDNRDIVAGLNENRTSGEVVNKIPEPPVPKPVPNHPNAVKAIPINDQSDHPKPLEQVAASSNKPQDSKFHLKFHQSYRPNSQPAASAQMPMPDPVVDSPTPKPKSEPLKAGYYKEAHKYRKWIAVAAVVVVLGGAVAWFLFGSKPVKAPSPTTKSSVSSSSSKKTPAQSSTTPYTSSNLNLSFNYPTGWKVVDVAGSGVLTATSPTTKLNEAGGQQVDGQILLTIRTKTQTLPEFTKGNATAVLHSQKINYTNPTPTQRASTYISFLKFASSSATGLDGIYITSDIGYQKGQSVPQTDVAKVNPLIDITFVSNSKTVTIAVSKWSDTSFSIPLVSILESMALQ